MPITRRKLLQSLALAIPGLRSANSFAFDNTHRFEGDLFTGSVDSLSKYIIPDWFRDAKFGIWAHWGPQSAIEAGDWYARNMYIQGQKQYAYHVEHYGHPSKSGYKDTIKNWKAEKFDPDHLLGLYKKAGAKYFMTMGAHHDNFDLWNSKHNKWNSVEMGPHKDIVGMFRTAAIKHELKFGISDHLWISPKWFSVSKGSDKEGPLTGVKYDGADPAYASLYGDSKEIFLELPWNEEGISEEWKKHWFERIIDLVDHYQPDLLYCDGHLPFQQYGLDMLAHYYNLKIPKGSDKTQAVYTSKLGKDSEAGLCVFDVERGVVDGIWPRPWQTDTCIGDWHYNRERVGKYKSAKTVVDLLVDIVSRNGNLMLNFPLPASGMPDDSELVVLDGITKWMAVNSEGIYATKPWKIFGTGPQAALKKNSNNAEQFNEQYRKDLNYEDVRFTTKGNTLYAFFMGWPGQQQITIKPLSTASEQKTGAIALVELLGHGKVSFTRNEEGLNVMLPSQKPCEHAYALKISGNNLV